MLRVICYDISSDRLRARMADALEEVAVRVQESVYEARLTHRQATRLMARLKRMADPDDRLRLYTIPDTMIARCAEAGGPSILGGSRYWLA